jgi:hypothetical protein
MKRSMNKLTTGLILGLVVALQCGCARTATETKPFTVSDIQSLSGKVVETMDVGGYTYVNLEKDGKTSWAAFPATKVNVGQEVAVRPGTQMGKFTSKSLNRTFDEIVFSPGLVSDSSASLPSTPPDSDPYLSLPPGHRPLGSMQQTGHGQSAPAPEATTQPNGHTGMTEQPGKGFTGVSGKVVETMNSGGYTYICLENDGKKVWAAVPTMQVSVGQELILQPGQAMSNFKSKSLNRSFDSVIFSGGALPATK